MFRNLLLNINDQQSPTTFLKISLMSFDNEPNLGVRPAGGSAVKADHFTLLDRLICWTLHEFRGHSLAGLFSLHTHLLLL